MCESCPQSLSDFLVFFRLLEPTTFTTFNDFQSFPNDFFYAPRHSDVIFLRTITTMIKSTNCFEHSVTMSTESVGVDFFVEDCRKMFAKTWESVAKFQHAHFALMMELHSLQGFKCQNNVLVVVQLEVNFEVLKFSAFQIFFA